jgi:hypothetical protein
MLSDWSINGHFSSCLKGVQVSGDSSSLEVSVWSVELDQDINESLLVNSSDWGVWLLDLVSFKIFSTRKLI